MYKLGNGIEELLIDDHLIGHHNFIHTHKLFHKIGKMAIAKKIKKTTFERITRGY